MNITMNDAHKIIKMYNNARGKNYMPCVSSAYDDCRCCPLGESKYIKNPTFTCKQKAELLYEVILCTYTNEQLMEVLL